MCVCVCVYIYRERGGGGRERLASGRHGGLIPQSLVVDGGYSGYSKTRIVVSG